MFLRATFCCCLLLMSILAFGQTSAITEGKGGPTGQMVARASATVRIEEPTLATAPAPAAIPPVAASLMRALEERLAWME